MTKIAEAYIHLDINLNADDRRALASYLRDRSRTYSAGIYPQEVQFEVVVENGSLKVWVLVGGTLFIQAVSNYGGIRSGIDYAIRDARHFSEKVFADFEDAGVKENQIIRQERRLGVPGRLRRIFKALDRLQNEGRNLSADEYQKELEWLNQYIESTFEKIDNTSDMHLIRSHFPQSVINDLPNPRSPNNATNFPVVALRPEEYEGFIQTKTTPMVGGQDLDDRESDNYKFSLSGRGMSLLPKLPE